MFDLIAGTASIIGLAISVWTLVVAVGAKRAASEAREAVRKGNAAEEFKNLSRIADEFLGQIEGGQVAAAALRARDLMSAISLASRRWGRFLTAEGRNNIEEAYGQISVISRSLSATGAPANAQQKDKLLKICHGVVRVVSNEAGTLFSNIEEAEEE